MFSAAFSIREKDMEILTGTRREIATKRWKENLEKYIKKTNDSMECFRRFSTADDLAMLIEDCEKLAEIAKHAKKAIEYMDNHPGQI